MGIKISQMTLQTTIATTDSFEIATSGGQTYRVTLPFSKDASNNTTFGGYVDVTGSSSVFNNRTANGITLDFDGIDSARVSPITTGANNRNLKLGALSAGSLTTVLTLDYLGNSTFGGTTSAKGLCTITSATTESAALDIGSGRTGNGYAWLDLIGDATYTDYGLRLVRNNTGANASSQILHRGTGALQLQTVEAASVEFATTGTLRGYFGSSGGLVLGSPTGGDKGSGALNVSVDIYKNNSAYTNPDYAFEYYFTGEIVKFKDNPGASNYTGLMPLDDLRGYVETNYRFPKITDDPMGMFERGDFVLEKLEELTLYIFGLHERIKQLEAA